MASHDLHGLLDRIVDEYGQQLALLQSGSGDPAELRRHAKELELLNGEIARVLHEEGRSSEDANRVLAALDERLRAAGRTTAPHGTREKLEKLFHALGVLSHKINNPLTALMGRAQILQFKKGTDPHVTKAAEVIEDSGKRIASYVRELVQIVRESRAGLLDPPSDATPPESPEQEGEHEGQD